MKTAFNFSKLALASLVILTFGVMSVWAQRPKGKVAPPPPPPPVRQESPPPLLPIKSVADTLLAPAGWMRYRIGEPERFSLILPVPPEAGGERATFATGEVMTVRTYMSLGAAGVYGANYIEDVPVAVAGGTEGVQHAFFDGFVKGFAGEFQEVMKKQGSTEQLKILEQRSATAGGLAGYEQDLSFGLVTGQLRLVFDGRRAYGLMALWPADAPESERKLFFESLRVNRKR